MRALEGALVRIVAFHSLTGRPITPELADEVLTGLYPGGSGSGGAHAPGVRPTVEAIQDATCELFGITREELLTGGRAPRVAWPRQLAMYLARQHTGATLPAIGNAFGGRNHTTVLHACRRAPSARPPTPRPPRRFGRCPNDCMPTARTDRLRGMRTPRMCTARPHPAGILPSVHTSTPLTPVHLLSVRGRCR